MAAWGTLELEQHDAFVTVLLEPGLVAVADMGVLVVNDSLLSTLWCDAGTVHLMKVPRSSVMNDLEESVYMNSRSGAESTIGIMDEYQKGTNLGSTWCWQTGRVSERQTGG